MTPEDEGGAVTVSDAEYRAARPGDPTLSGQPDEIDAIDVEAELAAWWTEAVPSAAEFEEDAALIADVLAPFGRSFPGLAHERPGGSVPPATTIAVSGSSSYVGLVAVERPADAIAVMGWLGPLNHTNDVGPLVAVLRSWEDRYDAVVVGLGVDTMSVAARRPPQTADDALALAAEHFAACPDPVWQGTESIQAYASAIEGQTTWELWWD